MQPAFTFSNRVFVAPVAMQPAPAVPADVHPFAQHPLNLLEPDVLAHPAAYGIHVSGGSNLGGAAAGGGGGGGGGHPPFVPNFARIALAHSPMHTHEFDPPKMMNSYGMMFRQTTTASFAMALQLHNHAHNSIVTQSDPPILVRHTHTHARAHARTRTE
jgi:hypothetical protein